MGAMLPLRLVVLYVLVSEKMGYVVRRVTSGASNCGSLACRMDCGGTGEQTSKNRQSWVFEHRNLEAMVFAHCALSR